MLSSARFPFIKMFLPGTSFSGRFISHKSQPLVVGLTFFDLLSNSKTSHFEITATCECLTAGCHNEEMKMGAGTAMLTLSRASETRSGPAAEGDMMQTAVAADWMGTRRRFRFA
jgi:hypothetical protein